MPLVVVGLFVDQSSSFVIVLQAFVLLVTRYFILSTPARASLAVAAVTRGELVSLSAAFT